MYDTVIVPLDGTSHAESALPIAVDEAQRHHATLVLIHVIPRSEPTVSSARHANPLISPVQWRDEEMREATELGHRYLERAKQRHGLAPGTVLTVVIGEPAKRILAEAERLPRSLIVMTTGEITETVCPPLSEVARRVLVIGTIPVIGVRGHLPESSQASAENVASPLSKRAILTPVIDAGASSNSGTP